MSPIAPLLGRTLVLVAHPDDEAVGCGALLQRVREPIVVFATDGAPRDTCFWGNYGSCRAYANIRAEEARRALDAIDVKRSYFLQHEHGPIVDQELLHHLPDAFCRLEEVITREKPEVLLTLAYEGGHPDHDCCSFLAAQLASEFGLATWEMPLYQRASGEVRRQIFVEPQGTELLLMATSRELQLKRQMFSAYASQAEVLRDFVPAVERLRPLAVYDYSRRPHAGILNYEAWQWAAKGAQLCEAFASFASARAARTSNEQRGKAA